MCVWFRTDQAPQTDAQESWGRVSLFPKHLELRLTGREFHVHVKLSEIPQFLLFFRSILLIFQQCLSNTSWNVALQVFFVFSQISTLFRDKFLFFCILPHIISSFENLALTYPWVYELLIRQHVRHSMGMLSHLVCSLCLTVFLCCYCGCVKQRATLFPSSFLLSLLRGPGMDA